MFAMLAPLGISRAGIYFVGQRQCSPQQMASNNLFWLLIVCFLWLVVISAIALSRPLFISRELDTVHILAFGLGGVFLLTMTATQDLFMASGSVLRYNVVEFTEPFLRSVLMISAVTVLGAGLTGVLYGWLIASGTAACLGLCLVKRYAKLRPKLDGALLKRQLAYGLKRHLSLILHAGGHRLDVFFVAALAGSAALGQYAIAFGLAELLWQLPFALGVILFPKVSALDAKANADTAAAICRRTLFLTLIGVLVLLACGRFAIGLLYGDEFLPGIGALYILAPSALFYTVHRSLGTSLAAGGMPEAGVYSGLVSFGTTVLLGLLLIPRLGIEGAALTSLSAYALDAVVNVALFMRVNRYPLASILMLNKPDIEVSLQVMRAWFTRAQPLGTER
jgi:O-antigen/teichoic acid export membrane protein